MKPDLIWQCRGTSARINRSARFDPEAWEDEAPAPLDSLRALIAESRIALPDALPQMSAGLFGYLGYDMVRLVERLPDVNPDPLGLPDAVMLRPSVVLVVDGVKGEVTIISPAWANSGLSPRAAYAQAAERVMDAVRDLDRTPASASRDLGPDWALPEPVSNTSREAYLATVEKAKEYIRAGDIFQVVPSQRWAQPFDLPPFALYRALRRTNPSPYMFYFDFGGFQVVGASPEILVRLKGDTVSVRPIAGTRPRGATPAEDARMEADLLADPKERAEHLMLLDLGRNDVARLHRRTGSWEKPPGGCGLPVRDRAGSQGCPSRDT
jgi:anthranilate synthase component 1